MPGIEEIYTVVPNLCTLVVDPASQGHHSLSVLQADCMLPSPADEGDSIPETQEGQGFQCCLRCNQEGWYICTDIPIIFRLLRAILPPSAIVLVFFFVCRQKGFYHACNAITEGKGRKRSRQAHRRTSWQEDRQADKLTGKLTGSRNATQSKPWTTDGRNQKEIWISSDHSGLQGCWFIIIYTCPIWYASNPISSEESPTIRKTFVSRIVEMHVFSIACHLW